MLHHLALNYRNIIYDVSEGKIYSLLYCGIFYCLCVYSLSEWEQQFVVYICNVLAIALSNCAEICSRSYGFINRAFLQLQATVVK